MYGNVSGFMDVPLCMAMYQVSWMYHCVWQCIRFRGCIIVYGNVSGFMDVSLCMAMHQVSWLYHCV